MVAGRRPRHSTGFEGERRALEEDQIVAVDDLVAVRIAEQLVDAWAALAFDALDFVRAVGNEASGDLARGGIQTTHQIADPEARPILADALRGGAVHEMVDTGTR